MLSSKIAKKAITIPIVASVIDIERAAKKRSKELLPKMKQRRLIVITLQESILEQLTI